MNMTNRFDMINATPDILSIRCLILLAVLPSGSGLLLERAA